MTHPPELKAAVLQARETERLTMDQLAGRFALSRSTVYHWIRSTPSMLATPSQEARARGAARNSAHWARLRDAAYATGAAEFHDLCRETTFRDFVCMYIGEGYKRNRNAVAICNSDPGVLVMSQRWMQRFSRNKLSYSIQFHADQDLNELRDFWSLVLDIEPDVVRFQRKSNSNQLTGRMWRSEFGVLNLAANDTYLRARLQAWMDGVRQDWH